MVRVVFAFRDVVRVLARVLARVMTSVMVRIRKWQLFDRDGAAEGTGAEERRERASEAGPPRRKQSLVHRVILGLY